MHLQLEHSREVLPPCDIFFHIPKTGGQSLHNLISREYRHKAILNTHCGLMTAPVWQRFTERIAPTASEVRPRYDAVTGHMKFGIHDLVSGPSRYITFLREPVKRFVSYYLMLKRMGVVPKEHQMDPSRPDWNLSDHESLPRELDNGQTRALADADWDLPLGQCTEEHLKRAQANLDNYFAFVGVTEHFDLSLMLLHRFCGWRWRFYVPKNVAPADGTPRLSSEIVDSIGRLNQFDRQLHEHAKNKLKEIARSYGPRLRLELAAYRACNAVHQGRHFARVALKQKMGRAT
jgi:hypothetical protein